MTKNQIKIEKLKARLSKLEDQLWEEQLRIHAVLERQGWGHAMRNVKSGCSFAKEDKIKARIEEVKLKIQELDNIEKANFRPAQKQEVQYPVGDILITINQLQTVIEVIKITGFPKQSKDTVYYPVHKIAIIDVCAAFNNFTEISTSELEKYKKAHIDWQQICDMYDELQVAKHIANERHRSAISKAHHNLWRQLKESINEHNNRV